MWPCIIILNVFVECFSIYKVDHWKVSISSFHTKHGAIYIALPSIFPWIHASLQAYKDFCCLLWTSQQHLTVKYIEYMNEYIIYLHIWLYAYVFFPHQLLESSYLRPPFLSGAAIGAAIVATPFLERNDDLMSIQTHTLEDTKHRNVSTTRYTPWKINGWNLQPSPMKRKEHDLNQTSRELCSMLIFQGVSRVNLFSTY